VAPRLGPPAHRHVPLREQRHTRLHEDLHTQQIQKNKSTPGSRDVNIITRS
jgi:hypothetical protein